MSRKLLKSGVFALAFTGLLSGTFNNLHAQAFGQFASGVFMKINGSDVAYNTSGTGSNAIGTQDLPADLGSFVFHTGGIILTGGEMKTYKGNYSNVCGVTLYYSVRADGSSSASSTYQSIDLPYKTGCNGINFNDGFGPCSGNDQKWGTQSSFVSLFDYAPGDYILDFYFAETGSSNHSDRCNETQYYDYRNLTVSTTKFHILPRTVSGASNRGINNVNENAVGLAAALNVSIRTYPSPVKDILTIDAQNFDNGACQLQLTNIQGATSKNITANYTKGQSMSLDMSSYTAGMYFVRLQQGEKTAIAKIVKQ